MKLTHIFIFFISLMLTQHSIAQRDSREKIKTLKIAFITEQIHLTTDEAEKFWPIYNAYDEEIRVLERGEKMKLRKQITENGGFENITEKEAEVILKKIHKLDLQIAEKKAEFDYKLSKVISYQKILKLRNAEMEFLRTLMRKLNRNEKPE